MKQEFMKINGHLNAYNVKHTYIKYLIAQNDIV